MSRDIISNHIAYSSEAVEEKKKSDGKLLFTSYRGKNCGILIKGNRIIAMQAISERPNRIGAIYIAKVKNVVKELHAAFVEIANGEICFLPEKDFPADCILKQGDEIAVRIVREAHKTKQASVSAKLDSESSELLQTIPYRTCFSCVKEAKPAFTTILEEMTYPEEYQEIVTEDASLYQELTNYCEIHFPDTRIRLYDDALMPLNKLYAINTKVEAAFNAQIWLKSGAYLIIEPTEALTVIDVNSGKYEGRRGIDNTLAINKEAADEIALQLRLRNLSGIIIVDFISMKEKPAQKELLNYLQGRVKSDRTKTSVIDITPLGLVEITRKRDRASLKEQFAQRGHDTRKGE